MAPSMLRWCSGTSFGDIFQCLGTVVAWPVLARPALAVGGTVTMATVTGGPVVIVGLVGGTFEG